MIASLCDNYEIACFLLSSAEFLHRNRRFYAETPLSFRIIIYSNSETTIIRKRNMKAGYVIAFILWSILMVFIGSKLYREQVEVIRTITIIDTIHETVPKSRVQYQE